MALAATYKVILGTIGFLVFWVLAVFSNVPILPIGRTAGSLLGGMLMVIFQILTPEKAYAAIDLSILGLLFGTMVVSYYLQRADMFKYLGKLLAWKSTGPKDLLCRVCIVTAISSALFTNDTSCVILTEFVLKLAKQHNLPPHPFLLALATSANIGSSATPIGNPQNLVIAIKSGITFWDFLMGIFPAMLIGVFVNILLLLVWYWKVLSVEKYEADETEQVVVDEDATTFVLESTSTSQVESLRNRGTRKELLIGDGSSPEHEGTVSPQAETSIVPSDGEETCAARLKRLVWKSCVYLVTVCMLIGLLWDLNMSWTALTAALTLVVLDFKDARPSLDKVSYSLLVFFCGMFITVEGFNATGLPDAFWDLLEPYSKVNKASGVAVLSIVILVLSNVASNVPTVLLLGADIAASAATLSADYEKKAWLILAWVSTVAGNFSLLGSAANLIVCEQAQHAPEFRYTLTFWKHLKFGLPSTLIVIAIGLTVM